MECLPDCQHLKNIHVRFALEAFIQLKKYGNCSFYGTNHCFLPEDDLLGLPSAKFPNKERRVFVGTSSGDSLRSFCENIQFPLPKRQKNGLRFGVAHN